jgi:hypothetical protein
MLQVETQSTDKTTFEDETCLLIEIIAETVLNERGIIIVRDIPNVNDVGRVGLNRQQCEQFIKHCDERVRWMDHNNPTWHKKLRSKRGSVGRDYLYIFVNHWTDSFLQNPVEYFERHKNFWKQGE